MKKKLIKVVTVLCLICAGLIAMNQYSKKQIYDSLNNVFLEMNYAAIDYDSQTLHLPNLSSALKATRQYKKTYQMISLPLEIETHEDEKIAIIVGTDEILTIEYRKKLSDNIFLYLTQAYKDGKVIREVEISNSDISHTYALQNYQINKKRNISISKEDDLKSIYWFSSSKGLPSLQLTNGTDVLTYLKPYGIDEEWLNEKSNDVLYHIILKRWFENGSQRYSLDNLGDVKIVPLAFTD